LAERFEMNLFGAHVLVLGSSDGPWKLSVDRKQLHSDYQLSINRVGVLSGVGYALGRSGRGGNACDSAPFIVSFPPGKPARLDGPVESCASVEQTITEDKIVFREKGIPGEKTHEWTWTPVDGLRRHEIVNLTISSIGWDSLRERAIQHPVDLLRSATFSQILQSRLGAQFGSYRRMVIGPGSVDFQGEIIVASSCAPHSCGEEEQLTVIDPQERTIYVAIKPARTKIAVFPEVKLWPDKPRAALTTWMRKPK
jgi:hypothetical protein